MIFFIFFYNELYLKGILFFLNKLVQIFKSDCLIIILFDNILIVFCSLLEFCIKLTDFEIKPFGNVICSNFMIYIVLIIKT
jgi:hypothetical protein